MKPFWREVCLAGLLGVIAPGVIIGAASLHSEKISTETSAGMESSITTAEPAEASAPTMTVQVITDDGSVQEMALEDYLVGVVLAEIPVSFEAEAQKAQAVVARTYAVRACTGHTKHDYGDICTDSGCCQGYISQTDYLASGGTQEGIGTVCMAVEATAGYVLTYEGELIEATYFSCSGGSTEDAVAVWGTDVPYLRATDSPGEENAAHYTDTVTFTAEEFASALALDLQGDPSTWLGAVTYTAGGGVDTMEIGGIRFQGTVLRKVLNLRSTAFTITATEEGIEVTTKGYGHRVGMSQYGADAMAAAGSNYAEILMHYYQGVELKKWTD